MRGSHHSIRHMAACCLFFVLSGCDTPDIAKLMESHLWTNRVLLVFSPTIDAAPLLEQQHALSTHQAEFNKRDVAQWQLVTRHSVSYNGEYKAHMPAEPFYEYFGVPKDQFTVILLGKDGEEKLRNQSFLSAETIFEQIDAMPMRSKEMLLEKTETP